MEYTVQQIMQHVESLDPRAAAAMKNGGRKPLVRTQVYEAVIVDGAVVKLVRKGGKYAVGYIRVSTQKAKEDGFSAPEQAAALISKFIDIGQAFCLVSDAGLSGGLPWEDDLLIADYRSKSAQSYELVFRAIFLSNPLETEENREGMEAYLAERLLRIRKGGYLETEEEILAEGTRNVPRRSPLHFRPGLTVLMEMLEKDVHTVWATDWSRVSRSELVTAELIKKFDEFGIGVGGVYQNLDWLGGKELGAKLLTVVYAHQYQQTRFDVLLGGLRGIKQKLMSGMHHGNTPSWLRREGTTGKTVLTEIAEGLEEGIKLYASEPKMTMGDLAAWLNVRLAGSADERHWTDGTVAAILENPAIVGDQLIFGKRWPCYPALITEDVWEAVQEKRRKRAEERNRNSQTEEMREWLLSGILKCWCGFALNSRNKIVKVAKGKKSRTYYVCTSPKKSASDPQHGRLRQDLMEEFFNELMAHHSMQMLEVVARDNDIPTIEAELREAEEDQIRTKVRWAETRQAVEAEKTLEVAEKFGLPGGSATALGMVALLINDDKRLHQIDLEAKNIQARVDVLRRSLTDIKRFASLDSTRRMLVQWPEIDSGTRNTVLKRVFTQVKLRRDGTGFDPMFPRLRQPAHVIPIYFEDEIWRGRRIRKLMNPGRWVYDMIRAEEGYTSAHDTAKIKELEEGEEF